MKNRGFTIIEAVIILVIVGIVATLGVVAYNRFLKPATPTASETTEAPVSTEQVTSTSDLDKVTNDLDSIDLSDSSDTTAIDSDTSNF